VTEFPAALELIELRLSDGPPVYAPKRLPGGKRHWSHSAQNQAERCPAAYKHRYLDGNYDPPTGAMTLGGAFGTALHAYYAAALASEQLPTGDGADIAVAHLE